MGCQACSNIGVYWHANLAFVPLYPVPDSAKKTITELQADKMTSEAVKQVLQDVASQKGPSSPLSPQFVTLWHNFDKTSVSPPFATFLWSLAITCQEPNLELYVRDMIFELFRCLGFHDLYVGLQLRRETIVHAVTDTGVIRAKPELSVQKMIKSTLLGPVIMLASEGKPFKLESRDRSSSQLLGELVTGSMFNFLSTQQSLDLIAVYVNGPCVRIVSWFPSKEYLFALYKGSLAGVQERPILRVWPPHSATAHKNNQGFDLRTAEGRLGAFSALADIRHYLICSCPKL